MTKPNTKTDALLDDLLKDCESPEAILGEHGLLKKPRGWGGFTTQDLARCWLMARMVALAYNWWTLFVRLAQEGVSLTV